MDNKRLNDEGRKIWNQKATFWDELFGDFGNRFHRQLVEPSILKLLELRPGEAVLDVCCGNGVIARRLAEVGAIVTAIDFSEEMLRLARLRGTPADIDYQCLDATDEAALLNLGDRRFNAIVCSMALMDIPAIDPLFRAAAALLTKGGRFIFATMHPAFNSNNPIFVQEKLDNDGVVSDLYALKLRAYLDFPPVKGSGAPGEPAPHYYYHRTLGELLDSAFTAGFVLDALVEPAFTADDTAHSDRLDWAKMTQFPPVLSGRFRLL